MKETLKMKLLKFYTDVILVNMVQCPPTWTSYILLQGVKSEEVLNPGGTQRPFFTQNRGKKFK